MQKVFFITILFFLTLVACQKTDYKAQIDALETQLAAQYVPEQADSLISLYKLAVAASPGDHATCIKYLTRAAEIEFTLRSNGSGASQLLDNALNQHGAGLSLTEPMGLLARIYNSYNYKSAAAGRMTPPVVDALHKNLEQYTTWIDSSLVLIDSRMHQNGIITNKSEVTRFVETAEGYAAYIMGKDKSKAAKLLMKAAGAAKTVENFNKSIQLYASVSDRMGDEADAPAALFMQGFIYENDLKDLDKAKSIYNFFLQRYPDNADYTDDVKTSLKNLGKSPEEMIKEFEKSDK